MADVNQLIIEEGLRHWPVYVGVAVMLFGMWKWLIPSSIRSSLENGAGEAVRRSVKLELVAQDSRLDDKLEEQNSRNENHIRDVISQHEHVEKQALENLFLRVKGDSDKILDKVLSNQELLKEQVYHIERKLKMKIRGRPKDE